ncbi:MAG: hypothetical protein H0V17_15975 [Deltaproteobacteria bacterium]|nr:hypothetical protein [Deltaproteobacteria bacterium]
MGSQTGLTTCGWWPQDPNTLNPPFDQTKLISSDLSKNLQAVRNGQITLAQVQVDDAPVHGGDTKIGPSFPTGSLLNGCWLEKGDYDALPVAKKPPRIPSDMQCRDYELTSVWYWSGTLANRRFWGFHAEITAEQGTSALVSVWPAGKSLEAGLPAAGSWWLNLPNVAHPIEAGFTAIGTGLSNPKQGALFLDAPTRVSLGLSGPKLPRYQGSNIMPQVK